MYVEDSRSQCFTCREEEKVGRASRVQAPSDAVPLIFGVHCTCVFSYLSKPLSVNHP